MEDVGEGGLDTERIIHHVTWSLKQQVLSGRKHKQHVVIHACQTLECLACSMHEGTLMRTESS